MAGTRIERLKPTQSAYRYRSNDYRENISEDQSRYVVDQACVMTASALFTYPVSPALT